MDVGVAYGVSAEVELIGRSSQVALLEDVDFQLLREEHPHSDVKFAA